jgi:hypothetical protein
MRGAEAAVLVDHVEVAAGKPGGRSRGGGGGSGVKVHHQLQRLVQLLPSTQPCTRMAWTGLLAASASAMLRCRPCAGHQRGAAC